jgi:hypothetical protein
LDEGLLTRHHDDDCYSPDPGGELSALLVGAAAALVLLGLAVAGLLVGGSHLVQFVRNGVVHGSWTSNNGTAKLHDAGGVVPFLNSKGIAVTGAILHPEQSATPRVRIEIDNTAGEHFRLMLVPVVDYEGTRDVSPVVSGTGYWEGPRNHVTSSRQFACALSSDELPTGTPKVPRATLEKIDGRNLPVYLVGPGKTTLWFTYCGGVHDHFYNVRNLVIGLGRLNSQTFPMPGEW